MCFLRLGWTGNHFEITKFLFQSRQPFSIGGREASKAVKWTVKDCGTVAKHFDTSCLMSCQKSEVGGGLHRGPLYPGHELSVC